MPLKAPPPVAAKIFSWTGVYVGAEAGYGDVRTSTTRNVANTNFPAGFSDSTDYHGGLFGFEAGANYQLSWIVFGVEGDWQGSTIHGSTTVFSPLIVGHHTVEDRETDWIASAAGRLGVAWDRWLVFGKAGPAWRQINNKGSNVTLSGGGGVLGDDLVASANEQGYVAGGGVEWAPFDALSLKVEYDWYDFRSQASASETCVTGSGCVAGTVTPGGESTSHPTVWEIKGGMNIRFNWL